MPLLGFTTYQKNFFLVVFGAVLVALSFSNSVNKRKAVPKARKPKREIPSSVFVDGHGSLTSQLESNAESVTSDSLEVSEESENERVQS